VPQYHAAQAYAALFVVADAIQRAGKADDPTAIRDALRQTKIDTIFGPIAFDKTGQNDHPMLVTQVVQGKFVTVWQTDVATLPIPCAEMGGSRHFRVSAAAATAAAANPDPSGYRAERSGLTSPENQTHGNILTNLITGIHGGTPPDRHRPQHRFRLMRIVNFARALVMVGMHLTWLLFSRWA
jgi:hypothetical protein